jgi:hypothetical protein
MSNKKVQAAITAVITRRVGIRAAQDANPWFFPDEGWARRVLEDVVGGWRVERAERVWRPTVVDTAVGVDGWVRLMGKQLFEAVADEAEREACIREAVEVLEAVCAIDGAGESGNKRYLLSYVRLRVLARRVD